MKDAFGVRRLGIHGGQDKAGDGRNQEAAPLTGAWVEKCISGPSRWLVRRETLQRFSDAVSRAYPAVMWDVSTTFVFSRPSTKLHSAGKNSRVNSVPTNTPPIST